MLTAELRKNTTYNILEALGLTTYSNCKPTIHSYITLFESLWKQKQLYDELEESHQLELANEEVKLHSKMQNEFINIAAHEHLCNQYWVYLIVLCIKQPIQNNMN